MLSKSSFITVQLLEPTLYIEQNSNSSNVVRGTINVNLPKSTTVKSLTVKFDGRMETKSSSCKLFYDTNNQSKHCILTQYFLNS